MLGLRQESHRVQQGRLGKAKEQKHAPQQQRAHTGVLLSTALWQVAARGTRGLDTPVDALHETAEGLHDALAAAQDTHDDRHVDDVVVVEIEDCHWWRERRSFIFDVRADSDLGAIVVWAVNGGLIAFLVL